MNKARGQNEMKISRLRRFERFLRQKNTKYAFAQVSQSHQTTSTALGWEPSITDGVQRKENLVEIIPVFPTFSKF